MRAVVYARSSFEPLVVAGKYKDGDEWDMSDEDA